MVASAGTSGGGAGGSERSGGGWAGQVVGTSAGGEVTRSYLVPFEFKSGREYIGHRGQVRRFRSGARGGRQLLRYRRSACDAVLGSVVSPAC